MRYASGRARSGLAGPASGGHELRRARAALLPWVLVAAAAACAAAASGPTEVSASRVEFQRFDPRTGMLALRVSADRASASGELAQLTQARLTRYGPSGGVVLEATADSGRMRRGGGVTLEGNVRVRWRGAVAMARFRAPSVGWDAKEGALSTDEPVRGTLEGLPSRRVKVADGEARRLEGSDKGSRARARPAARLDLEGMGLVVSPGRDRGEIASDAVVVVGGVASGPWRATADKGLVLEGFAGERPVLRLRGPVAASARGISTRSDAAELHLRRSRGKAGAGGAAGSDAKGGLEVSRAWATGQVHARIDRASAGPGDVGRVEARAEAAELLPGKGGAVLTGTISDPARAIFPSGVVRGTRVALFPGSVSSDGGARSEFILESPVDGRPADGQERAPPVEAPAAPGSVSRRESSSGPLFRVECEGPVRWNARGKRGSALRLSGGVRTTRGDLALRSLRAEVLFPAPSGAAGGRDAGAPEFVQAEGAVELTSPRFSARADVAEMRRVDAPKRGGGVGAPSFQVRLERRERAEIELRAGKVLVTCMGPAVYETSSRTGSLSGGVRARAPGVRMRCEEATVHLRPPGADKGPAPAKKPRPAPAQAEDPGRAKAPAPSGAERSGEKPPKKNGSEPAEAAPKPPPEIERIELRGKVVVDSIAQGSSSKGERPSVEGKPSRRIRASRAIYDAERGVIVFSGEPAVEVEHQGWVLTDREITLHVRENRIESSSGRLRAVKGPGR